LATHVATLAQRLDRSKYDVHVLCPEKGELRQRLQALGLRFDTISVQSEMDAWGDFQMARRVLRYLGEHQFDLVHAHSTKAGFWGRGAAWVSRVPVVLYTPHAYRFLRYPVGSPLWAGYVVLEWLGGRAGTGVIAVGPSEGRLTRRLHLAPKRRQFVVNNGVPMVSAPQARDPRVRGRLGLPERCPLVLTVGRFMRQKDPLAFVEVAAAIGCRNGSVEFVMVGEGELEPAVRRRAVKLGIAERLHIVPRTDMRVTLQDPPMESPGMKLVELDPLGRLLGLRIVPAERALPAGKLEEKPVSHLLVQIEEWV